MLQVLRKMAGRQQNRSREEKIWLCLKNLCINFFINFSLIMSIRIQSKPALQTPGDSFNTTSWHVSLLRTVCFVPSRKESPSIQPAWYRHPVNEYRHFLRSPQCLYLHELAGEWNREFLKKFKAGKTSASQQDMQFLVINILKRR